MLVQFRNLWKLLVMLKQMFMDEKAQISAEMILLLGAIVIIVCLIGVLIHNIAKPIADNITDVVSTARDTTINKL